MTLDVRQVVAVGLVAMLATAGCSRFGSPIERGQRLLDAGDYDGAARAFSSAIASGEDLAEAYKWRCSAYEAVGRASKAVEDCTAALELAPEAPDAPEVLNNRGVAYLGFYKYDEAIDDFSAAIELRPDYTEAYANRGAAHARQDRFSEAIADLERAVELDPEFDQPYGNLAYAYQGMGELDLAMAYYTRAIEIGDDPQAYINRAMLEMAYACWDEAYDDFGRVEEIVVDETDYLRAIAENNRDFLEERPDDGACSLDFEAITATYDELFAAAEAEDDAPTGDDAESGDAEADDETPQAESP